MRLWVFSDRLYTRFEFRLCLDGAIGKKVFRFDDKVKFVLKKN